jgi:tetratricopeptide (TPR) repeat protein
MTLSQIASELGVDAVVEPAVMCYGDSICFELKMITPDEKQIWFAEYQKPKSQIPNLHNQVTRQIADEVKIKLTPDEDQLLAESRTADPDALEVYFLGLHYLDKIDSTALNKASEFFNKSIEIDPDWAPPHAGLAKVEVYRDQMNFLPHSIAIPRIYENLNKALQLDPKSANAHHIKAIIAFNTEWNWEKGKEEFKKSLELNPSNAGCRMGYAHLLNILHRPEEAKYQADLAVNLDPHRPFILGLYGTLMQQMGDSQSALEYAKKVISIDPNHYFAKMRLFSGYFFNGNYDEWYEMLKRNYHWPDDVSFTSLDSIYQQQGYLGVIKERIKAIEEMKKMDGQGFNMVLGDCYRILNEYDKAMDYFELAYENHDPNLAYITTWVHWHEQLKDNPRYIQLLKKMNLPLPED